MAGKTRKNARCVIHVNDRTRSTYACMGRLAERIFQEERQDESPSSPSTSASWRNLLGKLTKSCRETAGLFSRYKELEQSGCRFGPGFVDASDPGFVFLQYTEQKVGGLDKALESVADFFDLWLRLPPGKPGDENLNYFIRFKMFAWMATNADRSFCYHYSHGDTADEQYRGDFLDEIEQTLQRLGYDYGGRSYLGSRIKNIRGQFRFVFSEEKAKVTPHHIVKVGELKVW